MAKKLNKKVAITGIVLLVLIIGGGAGALVLRQMKRNPEKALLRAHALVEAGDYEGAEKEFGRAFAYGKTDSYKVERLFEFAEFHLTQNEQHDADWGKARNCWNTVISIETDNVDARLKMLDFYYQAANAGGVSLWKMVHENTSELIDILKEKGQTPDDFVMTVHAKALLSIAQRGATTDREELLAESVEVLNGLVDKDPSNEEYYQLLSSASMVQGELDKLSGVMNASEKAQQKALDWLEQGVAASDDKATATANLLTFKLQTGSSDPNLIENIRVEIAERSQQVKPNGKLLAVTAIAYEYPGSMSREAEVNRAIDAIQQARELEPENAEYAIRLSRLLYRKGSAFNDPDAISDAIQTADSALLLSSTQDTPGPLRGQQLYYRNLLHTFLANAYLEKAYQAEKEKDDSSQTEWMQKAEKQVDAIVSYYASVDDNPTVQQFRGMLKVAQGDKDGGISLMYKAYEQTKALDKEGYPSMIDPVLCITLADLMRDSGEMGLEKEFMDKATQNYNRIILQKPDLILKYADLMGRLQGWTAAANLAESYQSQYGPTLESLAIQAKAAIAMWQSATAREQSAITQENDEIAQKNKEIAQQQLQKAEASIAAMGATDAAKQFTLDLLNARILQLWRSIEQTRAKNESPSNESLEELSALRQQRNKLLGETLQSLGSQTVSAACYDLLRDDKASQAIEFLDQYLAANPDNLNLKILRLQAQEGNPLDATSSRPLEIQEDVFRNISDPQKRALTLAQFYRIQKKYEDAQKALDSLVQDGGEINTDILNEQFELALVSENVEKAESLLQSIRSQNADGYQGVLSIAQVDILKKDYTGALTQLDRCLTMKPLSSRPYFVKSQVYAQEGKMEEAVENAKMAHQMSLMNPLYSRNLASVLFARNTALGSKATPEQLAEAERAVQLAQILNPTDANLRSVGVQILSKRSPDKALSIRQQLLESNPTVANALMLGNMAMDMAKSEWDPAKKTGLIELAGKAYQKAYEIDPQNEAAKNSIADYNLLMGKEDLTIFKDDKNLLWKYYLRGGQFDQAREILEKLYSEDPSDPLVLRGLILTESGVGNRQKTKTYLDAFAALDQDKNTELWILQKYLDTGYAEEAGKLLASFRERYPEEKTALLIEAWTKMGQGYLDEALSLTNRYLETNTQNPGAWRLRGRLYRLMNQPENAIKDLQQSKSILDDPMVRLELATIYNETNQTQAAIGELKQGIDDPQAPVQLRLLLESIYQKNNSTRDLEIFYESTLEKFPASTFWMYRASLFYLLQENYKQAQSILESIWTAGMEQNRPDAMVLNSYLGSLYLDKQTDKALALASSLIDLPPLAPLAYAWMGQIQGQQGQKEAAIESFDKALEKAGVNDAMQSLILQKMLESVGREAVVQWYQKQLSQDEKSLAAHLMASRLAQEEEAYNKAIEHVDSCIDIIGDNSPAWISYALKKANFLILAYTKTGDTDYLNRSISLFEKILVLQPENPSLLNNMAYLLADNDQQLERALDYSRKAHQRDPGNAVFLDTYAYIQCKMKDYGPAEQNLIRAIQIYDVSKTPVPWDLYHHLGMAQEGLQKPKLAAESYQKALDATDEAGRPQVIPEKEKQKLQKSIDRLSQS